MNEPSSFLANMSPLQRAVYALREATSQLENVKAAQREPIAIVGLGCRFPGGENPDQFWNFLAKGGDAVRDVPPDRWDIDAYYDPDPEAPGKMYSRQAAFIDHVDLFDPVFFGISPREAVSIDPQQRLLLEVCWEALEDGAQAPLSLRGSRTGVFVGIMTNDYFQKQMATNDPSRITSHFGTGGGNCFAAGRISHFLGLQGPSLPLDTACSSSLVAIHLACRSLRARECDLAMAGGVNLMLAPGTSVCMAKLKATAVDGRCKTFDASADGYGRGEGCGVVVLKRLSDAIANGDPIRAIIRGSAVNHDGPSGGLTLPNGKAQQAVIREAMLQAGVSGEDIDYVEVHGTGTPLGDPIEVNALASLLCSQREQPLLLGTVKTNIGHLEAAAGIAGLAKVVLALKNKVLPPNLHLRNPNKFIEWDRWPIQVPDQCLPWPSKPITPSVTSDRPASKGRLAGLSSFGLSGTNAHLILQEPPIDDSPVSDPCGAHLLTLSARDPAALKELVLRYRDFVSSTQPEEVGRLVADLCYTSNVGRSHFGCRYSSVVRNMQDVIDATERAAEDPSAFSIRPSTTIPSWGLVLPNDISTDSLVEFFQSPGPFGSSIDEAKIALESALNVELSALTDSTTVGEKKVGWDKIRLAIARLVWQWAVANHLARCGVKTQPLCASGVGRWTASVLQGKSTLTSAIASLADQSNKGTLESFESFESLDSVESWIARQDLGAESTSNILCLGSEALGLAQSASVIEATDTQAGFARVIAWAYRQGVDIRWVHYHEHTGHRRCHLPTYPFQRRRYWLEESVAGTTSGVHVAHPLLGRKLLSPGLRESVFESLCEATAYLRDHRVHGVTVLPAAALIEMGLAAVHHEFGSTAASLSELQFQRPLVLLSGQSRFVQTVLSQLPTGDYAVQIISRTDDEIEWTTHALAVYSQQQSATLPKQVPWEQVQSRFGQLQDAAPLYAIAEQLNLTLGPHFRRLEAIARGSAEALGHIRADIHGSSDDQFLLPPGVLDACLQAIGAACERPLENSVPLLPTRIGKVELHGAGAVRWCHAIVHSQQSDSIVGEARLYTENGGLVAVLSDVHFTAVSLEQLRKSHRQTENDWCLDVIWQESSADNARIDMTGEWLLLDDDRGVGAHLSARLEANNAHCQRLKIPDLDPSLPEFAAWFDSELMPVLKNQKQLRGIVYLAAIDIHRSQADANEIHNDLASSQRLACAVPMMLLQRLAKLRVNCETVCFVTENAQFIGSEDVSCSALQSPVWGLARVAQQELVGLAIRCIDLDGQVTADVAADCILLDLQQNSREWQSAWRQTRRFVPRLRRTTGVGPVPYELQATERGSIEGLQLVASQRNPLQPHQVEIRVAASSLNFRDVLNVLGHYPGDAGALGGECAGQVIACGSDVADFQPGQAVVALASGGFGSHVITSREMVVPIPQSLSYVEAAGLPIAFLTAKMTLDWAGIRPGERILIHAATGGVGLAAVQIAMRRGAEVFATAGSESKRETLRSLGIKHVFDSRSLDFAQEILGITQGQGVDIVLNSLAGDFPRASLSAMSPNGRFIEIGKHDVIDPKEFAQLRPKARYYLFALDEEVVRDASNVAGELRDLMRLFESDELRPLPVRTFSIHEAKSAFRFMAQARHVGKIVVTHDSDRAHDAPLALRADATYLVTGGMGGIGLRLASWLVQHGARHLVLTGRTTQPVDAPELVELIEAVGGELRYRSCDVSVAAAVEQLLNEIDAEMPPLAGIFHLAGVLDDGLIVQQDWARFRRVLAPKLMGSMNLHQLSLKLKLDHFVLFSSAASLLGGPGQATYAAANAFLDSLAHNRRAHGLCGISINWGPWAEVGMATRVPTQSRKWAQQGIVPIEPGAGLDHLNQLLENSSAQNALIGVDEAKMQDLLSKSGDAFYELLHERQPKARAKSIAELQNIIAGTPPNQRHSKVIEYVRTLVARTLGLAADQALDPHMALQEMGLDSLLAIDLVNTLSSSWGSPLSPTILFRYPSITSLSEFLVGEFREDASAAETRIATSDVNRAAIHCNSSSAFEPIAIIGMGCRLPGGVVDLASYWDLLQTGKDAVVEVPSERWSLDEYFDSNRDAPGKMYTRSGGFLSEIDKFDASFFGIADGEARAMDPQQRIFLEVAWEAIENANLSPQSLNQSATGVFLGISTGDYSALSLQSGGASAIDAFFGTGTAPSIAAGRLSYILGLKGPSLSIDTACSSSLVSVHLACQSLQLGECRTALAGGVNLILAPAATIYFCKLGAMSPDGRCKPFAADADGFVRGEGCGVVVLKRLSDAIADGDRVDGIIRATAVNHDGKSNGLTAPNAAAQAQVMERCLSIAGLSPDDIGYLEAHGTGTPLGDPIEFNAIAEVFARPRTSPLAIGSVKSNIGHLEAAAGIAGLIKLVLTLKNGAIPRSLHCESVNPRIDLNQIPAVLPRESTVPWPTSQSTRYGGASAFSFSGTNAHIIVEGPRATPVLPSPQQNTSEPSTQVLALSAATPSALNELIARHRNHVGTLDANVSMSDYCLTASSRRYLGAYRWVALASSWNELRGALSHGYDDGNKDGKAKRVEAVGEVGTENVVSGMAAYHALPKIALCLSGDASLLPNTPGQTISPLLEKFVRETEKAIAVATPFRTGLLGNSPENLSENASEFQANLEMLCGQVALGRLLQQYKMEPTWLMCDGIGMLSAACISKTLSLADAARMVIGLKVANLSDSQTSIPCIVPGHVSVLEQIPIERLQSWALESHSVSTRRAERTESLFTNPAVSNAVIVALGSQDSYPISDQAVASRYLSIQLDDRSLKIALARLFTLGIAVDWSAQGELTAISKVTLPSYPFQRKRYWLETLATHAKPMDALRLEPVVATDLLTASVMPVTSATPMTPMVRQLTEMSDDRRSVFVKGWLRETVARLLGRTAAELPADDAAGFFEMGIDSLKAVELGKNVAEQFGDKLSLPFTLTFDYPNIERLSAFILQSLFPSNRVAISDRRLTDCTEEAIAVVGIGCRMPGGPDGPDAFWQFLREGREALTPIPEDRWSISQWVDRNPEATDRMYCASGSFLPNIDQFDAWFFGISPREAKYLDPQQRLLLEVTWEALENAAIAPQALRGERVGVFVGISGSEYLHRIKQSPVEPNPYVGIGNAPSAAAGRLSYAFGFNGPSMVIDTACSSSLVAIHQACASLRAGESNYVLAAGVNVLLSPWAQVSLCQAKMLSPDGRCKTFSNEADGYGRGEGCGVLVMKRLSDAVRDRDPVWGVIRASAVNQDGQSSGLTVPNGPAQQELLREALAAAKLSARDVDYLEAHGTGTSLGDPIELQAIAEVFGKDRTETEPLRLGSVKTNIGHLEAAAGMAGLIKVLLAMRNGNLPPHIHCDNPTERFNWHSNHLEVNRQLRSWPSAGRPRRAGVSSFGFVGTNAHVVVEDFSRSDDSRTSDADPSGSDLQSEYLFVFSAKTEQSLRNTALRLCDYIDRNPQLNAQDVSYTLAIGRNHFASRLAIVAGSLAEASQQLRSQVSLESGMASLHSSSDSHASAVSSLLQRAASDYMNGADMDWQSFWSDRAANRIPLPTYVFERQRYWVDNEVNQCPESAVTTANANNVLSRELNGFAVARIASPLDAIQYQLQWSDSQPEWLRDHCLYGTVVIPAAAYISLCIALGAELGTDKPQKIVDFSFPQSLMLGEKQSRVLQWIAAPRDQQEYALKVCSLSSQNNSWVDHAEATWQAWQFGTTGQQGNTVSWLVPPTQQSIAIADFYSVAAEHGLELGSAFRWLESIRRDSERAWATLRATRDKETDFALSPGLIDACFQLLGCALPLESIEPVPFIPVSVGSVVYFGKPWSDAALCYARLLPNQNSDSRSFVGQIVVTNEAGEILLELDSVRLQQAPQRALFATANKTQNITYQLDWMHSTNGPASLTPNHSANKTFVILANNVRLGTSLSEQLIAQGHECACAFWNLNRNGSELAESLATLWQQFDGKAITLISLHDPVASQLNASVHEIAAGMFDLVRSQPNRVQLETLYWITVGAQFVGETSYVVQDPCRAATWGFGRVFLQEYPLWKSKLVDVQNSDAIGLQQILHEVAIQDRETQIAWRENRRYVARLRPAPLRPLISADGNAGYAARLQVPGVPDSIKLEACTRLEPGPGQVEIEVTSSALNFRDVLNILNLYPGDAGALGLECCGRIIRVGPGEDQWKPGDWVVAVAPNCFSRFVITRRELIACKPAHLTANEAATIPIAFLTAALTLEQHARIDASHTVLIQLGTGAVGLAAIQIARLHGATIFATAGSVEKRNYLHALGVQHVFDSRTPDFADEVLRMTGGRGVDVILNSVAGDQLLASMRCLSDTGKFLEIGKIGIQTQSEFRSRKPQAQYLIFALDELVSKDYARLGESFTRLAERFDVGELVPINHRVFEIRELASAVSWMSRALHIGKVVLDHSREFTPIDSQGSYLITGGLGGLGRSLVKHLIDRGATHLVLCGRRQLDSQIAAELRKLSQGGRQIDYVQADVAIESDVQRLIAKCGSNLRGVFHLAGVLNDALIAQLDQVKWDHTWAPKVRGAFHLHQATQHLQLDHFVLFSSVAATFGAPAQSNYAAANAVLDALAHHRRALGLSAMSINWGPWMEAGMAAQLGHSAQQRWAAAGIKMLSQSEGMRLLDNLLVQQVTQIAAVSLDLPAIGALARKRDLPPMMNELLNEPVSRKVDGAWKEKLVSGSPQQQKSVILERLRTHLAHVLGWDAQQPISPTLPLHDMGLDSLMAVELTHRLSADVGEALPSTLLFNYPTLEKLTEYLFTQLVDTQSAPQVAQPPEPTNDDEEASPNAGSDQDILNLLEAEIQATDKLLRRGK